MTLKSIFTALLLTLLPAFAYASCGTHDTQAQSCAEGSVYDTQTGTCVADTTA
ncbi:MULTISPECIES: chitin-binding domain-containing protein [unclassified Sulfitobacter]|jgi:hypothetical protein|uniref:chitin-binding domain-containing protein n=1 Tax=unclassified Sulfitobacter TaxID=196795 RepID=UPI000A5D7118|nr:MULTISPECIES: chitin-binding domain-containing protein [unclassified Sulfitobacter]